MSVKLSMKCVQQIFVMSFQTRNARDQIGLFRNERQKIDINALKIELLQGCLKPSILTCNKHPNI